MTEAEKKRKRYIRAVRRRLNLPRDVKERVMSDFISAISAREEAGLTDDEIYTELGSPKKAAADLNEQMKEYAYRKSPWRFVFLAMAAVSGGWLVLSRLVMWLCGAIIGAVYYPTEGASVGIIGGADGPTAVFVTAKSSFDWDVFLMLLLLVIGVTSFLCLRRCKRKP
ncbi:MAG: DUF1700 domain-containing protein [Faecousia sp.]